MTIREIKMTKKTAIVFDSEITTFWEAVYLFYECFNPEKNFFVYLEGDNSISSVSTD